MNTLFFLTLSLAMLPVIASVVLFIKAHYEDKKFIIKETPFTVPKIVDWELSKGIKKLLPCSK